MYAHPWALAEMGVEAALDELGDLGVDGLQLALSYHVASFLTPRSPRGRVRAGDLGSVSVRYERGDNGLRPTVHVPAAEAVPKVLSAAAGRGMQVIAWLVYLYDHDLAGRYPDVAVRNAFGDVHPAQLCPSQPAVRDYVLGLTSAVVELRASSDGLTGLHAESLSCLPWDYGLLGLKTAVALGQETARLLGLCFCEACRRRALEAGIEVEKIAEHVRDRVDAGLSTGFMGAPDPVDAVAPYQDLLAGVTTELNRAVAALVYARDLRFSSTAAEPMAGRADDASRSAVRTLVDEVRVKVQPGASDEEVTLQRAAALSGCRPGTHEFAQYQLQQFTSYADLERAVMAAVSAGIEHHRFYEHSVLTDQHLEWLRRIRRWMST